MKTAAEIRREFIEFFCRKHGHTMVPGSPVIPHDDPTLLFTNAGMNQFKPIFLGQRAPYVDKWYGSVPGSPRRAANSQPCIRAGGKHNDLDDVGHDTYHHTFFEMLGNWSFGDYFKKQAIEWAWELITKVWGIDPSRLHATYFGGDAAEGLEPDHEARDLWCRVPGMSPDRVHPGNKKDNFWEMGDTGPCGPCSEMHIDLTPDKSGGALVNAGDERVIEFWNLVFIQFNRGPDGKLTPLPEKHVDTGMGFERITRIVQGKRSNYDIDVFTPIFEAIRRVSGATPYESAVSEMNPTTNTHMRDVAYRVIADHIRTLTFAIADGCIPDKDGRGYVLRRILRRAVRYGWQYLNLRRPFLSELVPTVVQVMGDAFPTLCANPERISEVLREEEESFLRTLERGMALFEAAQDRALTATAGKRMTCTITRVGSVWKLSIQDAHTGAIEHFDQQEVTPSLISRLYERAPQISAVDAFTLHDTFGFPVDLTELMARERGLGVDLHGYNVLMQAARERARAGTSAIGSDLETNPVLLGTEYGVTVDSPKYGGLTHETEIAQVHLLDGDVNSPFLDDDGLLAGAVVVVALKSTNFYAEQGGQVADTGRLITDTGEIRVDATVRRGFAVLHVGTVVSGKIKMLQFCRAEVSTRRQSIERNHTATHLLNLALRETLGPHIDQKGSLVDPDKTRFDFSHPRAVSAEEIEKIEAFISDQIRRDLIVDTNDNVPVDQAAARKINTLRAVFGEKYPDQVRVVAIGAKVADLLSNPTNPEWLKYSVEFCGGTHVRRTGEIGKFVLVSEEAVAKGVRRVVGLTGDKAREAIDLGTRLLDEANSLRSVGSGPGEGEKLAQALPQLTQALASATLPFVHRNQLRTAVAELQERQKQAQKAADRQSAGDALTRVDSLLAAATKHGQTTVVVADMADAAIDALKTVADAIKQKSGSAAILFGVRSEGKVTLLAAVTDDLIKRGVKAGDWVKAIAPIVEGGGGGPPTMAQAGGKNPAKLGEALEAAKQWIAGKLD